MHSHGTALKTESWRLTSAGDLCELQKQILDGRDPDRAEIVICHGTGCIAMHILWDRRGGFRKTTPNQRNNGQW